ncbi:MAG: hypothetical protein STSR0009_05890 [Methanoregula sp.]
MGYEEFLSAGPHQKNWNFPQEGYPFCRSFLGESGTSPTPHVVVYQNGDRIHVRVAAERMPGRGLIPVRIAIFIAASTPSVLQSQTRE